MKNIFHVWFNEYRTIFSDSGALLIFFGAFIIYPFIYPLPYTHEVLKNLPVAVIDEDHSQLSHQLTRMIDANEFVNVQKENVTFDQAKKALLKTDMSGIIYIPQNFEKLILRGEQASISVYSDASYFLIYKQVLSGIYQATSTLSANIEIKRMLSRGIMPEQANTIRDPLPLVSFPLFNASGGYATYVVPAVFVLMLQQTLFMGIGLLSGTQRENGSKIMLTDQSGSVFSIVLGKAMAYFSIYMVHATFLFSIIFRFYHFPQRGDTLDLALFLIPYLFACIFLAQAISGFFKTRETSIVVLLFSSIPALFLCGFSWPRSSIPDWLNQLALILPSTSGVMGFLKINQMGANLKDVSYSWGILLGLTLIYFILALFSVKNQYKELT